jgi:hypothetical protein
MDTLASLKDFLVLLTSKMGSKISSVSVTSIGTRASELKGSFDSIKKSLTPKPLLRLKASTMNLNEVILSLNVKVIVASPVVKLITEFIDAQIDVPESSVARPPFQYTVFVKSVLVVLSRVIAFLCLYSRTTCLLPAATKRISTNLLVS